MIFVFETSSGADGSNPTKYVNEHSFLQNWNATVLLFDNKDYRGVAPHIVVDIKNLKNVIVVSEQEGKSFKITGKKYINDSSCYPVIRFLDVQEG